MAKRGESGGTKKLPDSMLERVARLLNEAFAESGLTTRQAEKAWGIDTATLSKVRNAKGAVGINLLLKLRELKQMSIDDILGLDPLISDARRVEGEAKLDALLPQLAQAVEMVSARHPSISEPLEAAKSLARLKQVPEHVIEATVARHVGSGRLPTSPQAAARWWVDRFHEAHGQVMSAQEGIKETSAAAGKRSNEKPKKRRAG